MAKGVGKIYHLPHIGQLAANATKNGGDIATKS